MSTDIMPLEVRRYRFLMRILGVLYIIGAVSFFSVPWLVFDIMNLLPKVFRAIEPIPAATEHFWLVLATSMMVMLTIIAFASAASPQTRVLAYVHLASKLCSSVLYLYLFLFDKHLFAYFGGFITDFPIFLLVLWTSFSAFRALKRIETAP